MWQGLPFKQVLAPDCSEGQFPVVAAGCRNNCPLSRSLPAFWQSSLQSLKDHCCAQCRGTAALPSTAFALLLCSPFPTITSDTKERTISWLLGRAELDPLLQAGMKLSRHSSPLDLDPALWPAGAPSCCWWLPGWGTLALAHSQGAAVAQGFGQSPVLSQQPDWALRELCGANPVTVPLFLQWSLVLQSPTSAPSHTWNSVYSSQFLFNSNFQSLDSMGPV